MADAGHGLALGMGGLYAPGIEIKAVDSTFCAFADFVAATKPTTTVALSFVGASPLRNVQSCWWLISLSIR